jgi:putative flavoprotein involved in K+ transport
MHRTSVVIIGAGQAGLSVSRLLTAASIDHVVLDRGRIGESWRSRRWDSLRLLTPAWMTRLPYWSYRGRDAEGFLSAASVAGMLDRYAESFGAPVALGTDVLRVKRATDGFLVVTDNGAWTARAVVVATGQCAASSVPPQAAAMDPAVRQITPDRYRNPDDVAGGRVLVVGASATGVQLADELRAAGRDVVLAVGGHTRVPRRYRGLDIMWWLDSMALLTQPTPRGTGTRRTERSLQLVGSETGREVDLGSLASRGIELVGRLDGAADGAVTFADDLEESRAVADARLEGLLGRIDQFAARAGLDSEIGPPDHPVAAPVRRGHRPRRLALGPRDIRTVVWATGYRRPYPWLHLPVLDRSGEIAQVAGRTAVPGLFVVGMAGQTRRNSTFIDGVGRDAALVVDSLIADVLESSPAHRSAS